MTAFAARRLAAAVPVLLGITFVAFILVHLVPGNPVNVILYGSQATPQQVLFILRWKLWPVKMILKSPQSAAFPKRSEDRAAC